MPGFGPLKELPFLGASGLNLTCHSRQRYFATRVPMDRSIMGVYCSQSAAHRSSNSSFLISRAVRSVVASSRPPGNDGSMVK